MEETYHRFSGVRCKLKYGPGLRRLNRGRLVLYLDTEVENPHEHNRSIKVFIMLLAQATPKARMPLEPTLSMRR